VRNEKKIFKNNSTKNKGISSEQNMSPTEANLKELVKLFLIAKLTSLIFVDF